jgi:hypothetical protein
MKLLRKENVKRVSSDSVAGVYHQTLERNFNKYEEGNGKASPANSLLG